MGMSNAKLIMFLATPLVTAALPAYAYIGPGAGAGTVAAVLGILASVIMAFFAILWYPAKRFLKKRKPAGPDPDALATDAGPDLTRS